MQMRCTLATAALLCLAVATGKQCACPAARGSGTRLTDHQYRVALSAPDRTSDAVGATRPNFRRNLMKRLLLATVLCSLAAPAFADQVWDSCFKLATDRVGHISQSSRGHFQRFLRECVSGRISLPNATATASSTSAPAAGEDGEGGRVLCVKSVNGTRVCY